METLFKNAGKKIKMVSKVLLILMTIACIIVGIELLAQNRAYGAEREVGLGLIFLGPIVCWALCLFPYGFGVLVENSNKTSENSEKIANKGIAVNNIPSAGTVKNTVNTVSSTDDLPEL